MCKESSSFRVFFMNGPIVRMGHAWGGGGMEEHRNKNKQRIVETDP